MSDTDYGTLTDYDTTAPIRPATIDELADSLNAGDAGPITVDGRSAYVTGWDDDATDRVWAVHTTADDETIRAAWAESDALADQPISLSSSGVLSRAVTTVPLWQAIEVRDAVNGRLGYRDARISPMVYSGSQNGRSA